MSTLDSARWPPAEALRRRGGAADCGAQDSIHGGDAAQVAARIQQLGVDLIRRAVHKLGLIKSSQDACSLLLAQRAGMRGLWASRLRVRRGLVAAVKGSAWQVEGMTGS